MGAWTLRRAAALIALVALATATTRPAQAGLSLTVQPLVQELHVGPGGSAVIAVKVTNGGTEPETVTIEPIDWNVTTDGSLEFHRAAARNAQSITHFLSAPVTAFPLDAGATRSFPMTLRLPASFPADAHVYWGGYLVRAAGRGAAGVGPAGTVFVYNTVGTPAAHLAFKAMRVMQHGNDGAVLSARLQNDGLAYARLTARVVIEEAGKIVADRDLATPTIFPGAMRVVNETFAGLAPGSYRAELTIDYGTDVVLSGSTDFRIR